MSSLTLSRFNPFVFSANFLTPPASTTATGTSASAADRKTEMLCAFAELSMASHCIVGGPQDYYVHLVEAMATEHDRGEA